MAREIASVSTADANTDVKLNYSPGQLKPPHQSKKPSCASSTPSALFFFIDSGHVVLSPILWT